MNQEVISNHEQYLARKALYLQHGYDVDGERAFVIEKAGQIQGNILEAGTGKGYFTLALAQRGLSFTSFDLSITEQNYALLNLQYYGLEQQVHLHIANAESLSFPDGRFDAVFSVNMVHHLSSGEKVMDELIRVLSPSGKLVISDLNDRGFSVMDEIHALEGGKHEVGKTKLANLMIMLLRREFEVEYYTGNKQDTLVAYRRKS